MDIDVDCEHECVEKGICMGCGMEFSCLSEGESVRSVTQSSSSTLVPDIDALPYPQHIRDKAKEIYFQIETKTRKGKKRDLLLFFCIYNGHLEGGEIADPRLLAKSLKLKSGDATRALSVFSEAQTGYRSPVVNLSPLDLVPLYIKQVGLDEDALQDVLEIGKHCLNKDPELLECFPQKVAAGILLLYMDVYNIAFVKKRYAKTLELSEVTISNIYRRLKDIYFKEDE